VLAAPSTRRPPSSRGIGRTWQRRRGSFAFDHGTGTIEMSDYDLYYWPVPFRGQFVRAVLAYAGKTWTECDAEAMSKLMSGPVEQMPVPFMGPPMLIDKKADFAIAEMPAIILYLGETLDLLPATAALRAMTMKIVCGMELANAFVELTDAAEQRARFLEDRARRHALYGQEDWPLDEDFLAAMAHGMPASSGIALGFDRLAMIASGADRVDQVQWLLEPR
jgi:hypothetical protein